MDAAALTRMPEGTVDPERSALMKRVRSKNTKPELIVRRLVHGMGYRFRLHHAGLPGRPDLVFSSRKKVIFVHGCFWHRHPGCKKASTPKTRHDFWEVKFAQNVERDARKELELQRTGWDVFIVWECETKDLNRLAERLRAFLGPPGQLQSRGPSFVGNE